MILYELHELHRIEWHDNKNVMTINLTKSNAILFLPLFNNSLSTV
jgi:hypothetical protein